MSTAWFDLTASFGWRRPPSGIVRVEQECLRQALRLRHPALRYCLYDAAMQCWYELPEAEAAAILTRRYAPAGAAQVDDTPPWQPRSAPLRLREGDRYLNLSADQTLERMVALFEARQRLGLRVFGMLYDLIPVKFPHFYWNQADQSCARYLADVASIVEHLFCISQSARRDMLDFCQDIGVAPPPISVVRLGDALAVAEGEAGAEVVELCRQPFILTVGSIEIRKNHETLYRALLDLLARGIEDLPLLVFAGMKGWRIDDLWLSLELDPRIRGRIRVLPNATDADLAHLYRHCLFTVFPSQYEGWGLPVAESLAHGKLCLASRNSAIPEIAPEEMVELIDTFDVRAWADAMLAASRDAGRRADRERRIREQYRVTPWERPAGEVLDRFLSGLPTVRKAL
ncbi:MAG: glycosyltransferase family 4 protein [Pigmentiphaga sp.]|nr:glycosyltransferase family 4 protein [Pigmentiphaga sp.]